MDESSSLKTEKRLMILILFGPPGSGKGTYSRRLQDRLRLPAISTGDLFREARAEKSPLGERVRGFMDKGELVPDEIVNEVLKDRISKNNCRDGYILDGYPRTTHQVEFLIQQIEGGIVLNLVIPNEILVAKLSARRVCRVCGDIYNVADINQEVDGVHYALPEMAPKQRGVCDKCGSELYQREDDEENVIKNRLEVYKKQSKPVLDYFRKRQDLFEVIDIHVTRGPEIMIDKIISQINLQKID
jgi:adenylate kinase